ncbi:MAG TPA: nucleoside triphosphate pyrophosphatase [Burkholderiaceae bacterium]|nr:nucleoside triphosphate pyrophosphatase [Burkholderiaceae bacterium]
MADFYLASHSARRRELLRQVGARFETLLLRVTPPRGPDIREQPQLGESPTDFVVRVAREKAEQGVQALVSRSLISRPVLSADTVVTIDGDILGKPQDADQAAQFLQRLSGRTHEVLTAIALAVPSARTHNIWTSLSTSRVTLRALDAGEIARYCASGEPFGKAGGYAIQGHAALFIDRIEGSYSGIVGLPLAETAALLGRAGVRLL